MMTRKMVLFIVLFPSLVAQSYYPSLINKLKEDFETPAVVFARYQNGKWIEHYQGFTNLNSKHLVNEHTRFNVASISKMFTAIAALQVSEKNKIGIDEPLFNSIQSFSLPSSSFDEKKITIKNILNHSAGLSSEFGPGFNEDDTLLSLVNILEGKSPKRKSLRLIFEPNSKHRYSNLGFGLVQLLISEISKSSFNRVTEERIFKPLNMSRTTFRDPLDFKEDQNFATPYNYRLEPLPQERFVVSSAAGLISTVSDLKKFMKLQMNTDRLLSKSSFATIRNVKDTYFGLGHIVQYKDDKLLMIGHTGLGMGWNATFQFNPDKKSGIIVLTNGDNGLYIHQSLIAKWIYELLAIKSSHRLSAPNKLLNRLAYYTEVELENKNLDKSEFEKIETGITELRSKFKSATRSDVEKEIAKLEKLCNEKLPSFNDEIIEVFQSIRYYVCKQYF